jgi:hypothetical protein
MIPEMTELEVTRPEMEHERTGPNAPLRADGSTGMSLN